MATHDVEGFENNRVCVFRASLELNPIPLALQQVVEVLNPLVRDKKSVETLRSELAGLQEDLSKAHAQVPPFGFCNFIFDFFAIPFRFHLALPHNTLSTTEVIL